MSKSIDKINKKLTTLIQNQEYKKGIYEINNFINKYPKHEDDEWVLYTLGFLFDHLAFNKEEQERKELEEKALNFYQRIINKNPKSIKGLWGIARVFWHRGDEKALDYAKKAYKINKEETGSESFSNEVALVYEKLGKYKEAEKWLLKGLDEIEGNDYLKPIYANFIQFYKDRGNTEEAKKYALKLKKWFKNQPDDFKNSKSGCELDQLVSEFI